MAHRDLLDSDGVEWQVWAVIPPLTDGLVHTTTLDTNAGFTPELRHGWVAFQSRSERKRLMPIPPGWEEMNEAELRALLATATPVGSSRRLIE
jgi:hypothetical protein